MIPNYLICTSFYQEKRAIGNFIFSVFSYYLKETEKQGSTELFELGLPDSKVLANNIIEPFAACITTIKISLIH